MDLDQAIARIAELEAANATLTQSVTERDAKIEDMTRHAKEKGEQFKKLRDMTAAEKELLSEKELELMKRQEETEAVARKVAEDQQAFRLEQRGAVLKNLINKFAKGDVEIAKKIELNISQFKDADQAMTEEALAPLVQNGFNMIGPAAFDAVRNAHNQGGSGADYVPQEAGFAESPEGKALETALFGAEVVVPPTENK